MDTPLIAIGGSTGAPTALREILKALPADFPAAIVIAQHLDKEYSRGLVEVLDKACQLPVVAAIDGSAPQPGQVMVSQTNDHLVIDKLARIRYSEEPKGLGYRPSVDEMFASLALNWHGPILAVLLSGMGADGAKGLLALRRLGSHTISQSQESCAVYGMPKAAEKLNAAVEVLRPEDIAKGLTDWVQQLTKVEGNTNVG